MITQQDVAKACKKRCHELNLRTVYYETAVFEILQLQGPAASNLVMKEVFCTIQAEC